MAQAILFLIKKMYRHDSVVFGTTPDCVIDPSEVNVVVEIELFAVQDQHEFLYFVLFVGHRMNAVEKIVFV